MKRHHGFVFVEVVLLIFVVMALPVVMTQVTREHTNDTSNTVEIALSNPYRFDVNVLIKCDWNAERKAFGYETYFLAKHDRITTVHLPNNPKRCQIYPKVLFFNKMKNKTAGEVNGK